jgi:tRNA nucleotidyltransferase/poly(A) polymerase
MSKVYLVGGAVRESLMGLKPHDLDYTYIADAKSTEEAWEEMRTYIRSLGLEIFTEKPECFTIRAKAINKKGEGGDFVLARKEISYEANSRQPISEPGTLYDDLVRRDFTVNALAQDPETSEIIDFFGGKDDLANKILRTPKEPIQTLVDDPLRVLRCLRFSIKLNFTIDQPILDSIHQYSTQIAEKTKVTTSADRIREELHKAMAVDSYRTFKLLSQLPEELVRVWFPDGMWLLPTFKEKR